MIKKIFKEPQYFWQQAKPFILWKLNKITSRFSTISFSLKHLWIMLTYSCNLSCKMCGLWGKNGVWKEYKNEELKLSDIKNFIDEVAKFKPMVLLTGGEPMLNGNWCNIAGYIKEKKIRCCISTNGTLLKKYIEEVMGVVDVLDVSIDGVGKTHNEVRGADIFDDIILQLKIIDEKKRKIKSIKPFIKISYTINDINFNKICQTAEYLDKLDIDIEEFIIRHLQRTSQECILKHKEIFKSEFALNTTSLDGFLYPAEKIDIGILKSEIKNIKDKKFKNIKKINLEPEIKFNEIERFYSICGYIPKNFSKKCFAPYLGISILPNGDIWLCPDYVIGNVKRDRFFSVWNNEKAKLLRERIGQKGLFPACSICACLYVC